MKGAAEVVDGRYLLLVAEPVDARLSGAFFALALDLHEHVARAWLVRVELFLAAVEVRQVLHRAYRKEEEENKEMEEEVKTTQGAQTKGSSDRT